MLSRVFLIIILLADRTVDLNYNSEGPMNCKIICRLFCYLLAFRRTGELIQVRNRTTELSENKGDQNEEKRCDYSSCFLHFDNISGVRRRRNGIARNMEMLKNYIFFMLSML